MADQWDEVLAPFPASWQTVFKVQQLNLFLWILPFIFAVLTDKQTDKQTIKQQQQEQRHNVLSHDIIILCEYYAHMCVIVINAASGAYYAAFALNPVM